MSAIQVAKWNWDERKRTNTTLTNEDYTKAKALTKLKRNIRRSKKRKRLHNEIDRIEEEEEILGN